MKKLLLLIPISLGFSSCASIMSKSDYPVTFKSSTPTSFKIVNKNSGQVVHKSKTPATATLSASSGFFKPAKYSLVTKNSRQDLTASLDPWYTGNLLFGGILGGIVVDPVTGNMWKLPTEVNINTAK